MSKAKKIPLSGTFSPAYIRSLNEAMTNYGAKHPTDRNGKRNSPESLLRSYGYIHESIADEINHEAAVNEFNYPNTALKDIELASFNNWFRLHPGKVAGEVKITTSMQFPLTIIGGENEVRRCLDAGIKMHNEHENSQRLRIAKAKAKARIRMLNFNTI